MDGQLISIVGRRGEGKTLLASNLFLGSKKFSIFISVFNPLLNDPRITFIRNINQIYKLKSTKKLYCKFENPEDYNLLFKILPKMDHINIFIDEVSLWVNSHKIEENLEYLIKYTRQDVINLIFIARRPQELNPLTMSQTNLLISFCIQNIRDLNYLEISYGLGKKWISLIKHLKKYEFLVVGDRSILNQL